MTQRLADHWHAGTRAETGTNVKGTTRKPTDQIDSGRIRTAFLQQGYRSPGSRAHIAVN